VKKKHVWAWLVYPHALPQRSVWLKIQQVFFLRALHKFHLSHKITEKVLSLLNYKEPLGLFPAWTFQIRPARSHALVFNRFNSETLPDELHQWRRSTAPVTSINHVLKRHLGLSPLNYSTLVSLLSTLFLK